MNQGRNDLSDSTTDNHQFQEDIVPPIPHQHLGSFGLLSHDQTQRLSDSEPELLSHSNGGPRSSMFARQFPTQTLQSDFFPGMANLISQQQPPLMQQQHQRPLSTPGPWFRENPNGMQNLPSSTAGQVALVSRPPFDMLPAVDALGNAASTATGSVPFSPPPTPSLTRPSVKASRKRRLTDSDATKFVPKAKHVYTPEQDRFLASKLSTPRINEILQGVSDRNQPYPPKSKVHEEIAVEFNSKFETALDAAQIKNKVANMRKIWKETSKMIDPTEDNGLNYEMSDKVLKKCSFYYILEPILSVSQSPVPRRHIDSSAKLTDDDDDDDDDMDEIRNEEPCSFFDMWMTPPQAEYEREPKTRRVTSQTRLGDPIDANKLSEVSIIEQENTKRMLAELTHNKEVRIEKETTKREEQRETTKREKLRLEYKTEKIGMTTKIPTQLSDPVEGSLGADESKVSSIEQEVTKRILAKLSHRKEVRIEKETTKREERREETKREQLRLEHEREISKRLELELQLQQSKYEHPRMEMERSQQSNTTLSLYSRRAGQQTDMTPVTDGMEGLSAQ